LFNRPHVRRGPVKPNMPNFNNIITAGVSGYTPKLLYSLVDGPRPNTMSNSSVMNYTGDPNGTNNYIMIVEDVYNHDNVTAWDGRFLTDQEQINLLKAFIALGELGLELVDPNCRNIITNSADGTVKIIDDITEIKYEDGTIVKPEERIYYALQRLSKLQFNDRDSKLLKYVQGVLNSGIPNNMTKANTIEAFEQSLIADKKTNSSVWSFFKQGGRKTRYKRNKRNKRTKRKRRLFRKRYLQTK